MRVALDTNVLVYAEGLNGAARKNATLAILARLHQEETFIPVQVIGELFHVLTRKAGLTPVRSRDAILNWQDTFPTVETSGAVLSSAIEIATHHRFSIWDAVVVAAAGATGCRLLLSEDLQDGFTWNGVTVVNPYASTPNPVLAQLLAD
jgi:predicted nucleic acid-binding protein